MTSVWIVNEKGVLQGEISGSIDEDIPGMVTVPPPSGLLTPRWNGKAWVEGTEGEAYKAGVGDLSLRLVAALEVETEKVRCFLFPYLPHALAVREQKIREACRILYNEGQWEPIFLNAESSVTGIDIKALASAVVKDQIAWSQRIASVEIIRVKYQSALRSGGTPASLQVLYEQGVAALWALTQPAPEPAQPETGGVKDPPPKDDPTARAAAAPAVQEEPAVVKAPAKTTTTRRAPAPTPPPAEVPVKAPAPSKEGS